MMDGRDKKSDDTDSIKKLTSVFSGRNGPRKARRREGRKEAISTLALILRQEIRE